MTQVVFVLVALVTPQFCAAHLLVVEALVAGKRGVQTPRRLFLDAVL